MAENNKTPSEPSYSELQRLLGSAMEKAKYYQNLAEETGRRRLREIHQMSMLIAERKRSEDALRESEHKCRSLFNFSPQAIGLGDKNLHRWVDVNHKFCELVRSSREEITSSSSPGWPYFSDGAREELTARLKTSGEVHAFETEVHAKDGSIRQALVFARIIQIGCETLTLVNLLDMTEKKLLEAQLQHAQKMEAIGTLAGGIAHDFNNLLMTIQGNVSLALFDMNPADPHYHALRRIEQQVRSGARLSGQLLGYARKGKYEVKPVDLNELILETSETFGRTRKEITIHRDFASDLLAAKADRGQMEQALLNLYVNAAEAMPDGGDLKISTTNATHQDIFGKILEPAARNYVLLTFTDTGKGMDEVTRKRLFEPFFTTKEMGRGTGLGLAVVYGIIKGHGGHIDVVSDPQRGTTFRILLPATKRRIPEADKVAADIALGNGTILVVDDEAMVLSLAANLVKKLGYNVLRANGGKEAIRICEQHKECIDLIILDMIMPGVNGGEAYDRIKKINPKQMVLLSSGYSMDGKASEILQRGCDGFIQKPFNLIELSEKIRELLARA